MGTMQHNVATQGPSYIWGHSWMRKNCGHQDSDSTLSLSQCRRFHSFIHSFICDCASLLLESQCLTIRSTVPASPGACCSLPGESGKLMTMQGRGHRVQQKHKKVGLSLCWSQESHQWWSDTPQRVCEANVGQKEEDRQAERITHVEVGGIDSVARSWKWAMRKARLEVTLGERLWPHHKGPFISEW